MTHYLTSPDSLFIHHLTSRLPAICPIITSSRYLQYFDFTSRHISTCLISRHCILDSTPHLTASLIHPFSLLLSIPLRRYLDLMPHATAIRPAPPSLPSAYPPTHTQLLRASSSCRVVRSCPPSALVTPFPGVQKHTQRGQTTNQSPLNASLYANTESSVMEIWSLTFIWIALWRLAQGSPAEHTSEGERHD